jgi:hypothetical protein
VLWLLWLLLFFFFVVIMWLLTMFLIHRVERTPTALVRCTARRPLRRPGNKRRLHLSQSINIYTYSSLFKIVNVCFNKINKSVVSRRRSTTRAREKPVARTMSCENRRFRQRLALLPVVVVVVVVVVVECRRDECLQAVN